jgi:hypothetical protein
MGTLRQLITVACLLVAAHALLAQNGDLTGKWTFSVDLEDGGHGDPTFTLKQDATKLSGTYSGPMGEQQVTGTVTGAKAVFGFSASREGGTAHATYTATIDSPTKMHGTIEFKSDQGEVRASGKWTAQKQ